MKAAALVADLRQRGVALHVAGDRVGFRAPAGVLTPEAAAAVAADRQGVLACLLAEAVQLCSDVRGDKDRAGESGGAAVLAILRPPGPRAGEAVSGQVSLVNPRADWTASGWQAWFAERAGIREFDGGQTRPEAEAAALLDLAVEFAQADPDLCWLDPCGAEPLAIEALHGMGIPTRATPQVACRTLASPERAETLRGLEAVSALCLLRLT